MSDPSLEVLTARQLEVLRMLVDGLGARAIARKLKLSPKTVETHVAEIRKRLQIHSIAHLTRYAIRVGLLEA